MMGLALLCAFTPADAVRDAVAEHESVPVADVEIGDLGTLVGAPADAEWDVQLPKPQGLCGGVPVVLSTEGHRYAVHAPVIVWREVPVALTALAPGDRVTFGSARTSCLALRGETPVDPSRAWAASVSFPVGAPVTTGRVQGWPDLVKGASVRIRATAGGLTVAAPGQLMQDGFTGRKVAVLNLATRAVVSGVYTGNNIVEVQAP